LEWLILIVLLYSLWTTIKGDVDSFKKSREVVDTQVEENHKRSGHLRDEFEKFKEHQKEHEKDIHDRIWRLEDRLMFEKRVR
jgi:peptidoglycan hydrolase CwlO-like protein